MKWKRVPQKSFKSDRRKGKEQNNALPSEKVEAKASQKGQKERYGQKQFWI